MYVHVKQSESKQDSKVTSPLLTQQILFLSKKFITQYNPLFEFFIVFVCDLNNAINQQLYSTII